MKKIFLSLLFIICIAAAYVAGTVNASKVVALPEASWTGDSEAAVAWRELVVAMEAGAAKVFASGIDERERLDGLHYLSQLLSASLEMKLSKGDPAFPQFTDWMGSYRKFLGDSPDAVYHTVELDPRYRYQISGNIRDAEYLGFMLYGRGLNGWNRMGDNLSSEAMVLDGEGNFSLLLSADKPETDVANWLPLDDDIHMLMVRQYFHGREGRREALFNIENLSPVDYRAASDAEVAAGLREAREFFSGVLNGGVALAEMLSSQPNSSDIPKGYDQDFGGIYYPTHDNQYFGAWYKLAAGEALLIEGEVPDGDYWALSLQNRWMQSLDYQHRQSALHNHQIEVVDGRYRAVVAAEDPGMANWLDSSQHPEGIFSVRYQLSGEQPPPMVKLMKLSELRAER